jgi:uncharacterized protein (TIGR02246 family)
MKVILLLGALTVFISFDSFGQTEDIETIKQLNNDWLNALPKRDSSTLSKILADDFIMIGANGSSQTKKDNLMNLMSPGVETKSVNIDSVKVRLLTDDVGIVTAWTGFVLKIDDKEMIGKNCYQDVYMKRKNKWVAVSAHVTVLSIH